VVPAGDLLYSAASIAMTDTMTEADAARRIYCALDTIDATAAAVLADRLDGLVGGFKLGLEFFTANGPDGVRAVVGNSRPLFLDLKFHDIPNTVVGGVRAACTLTPAFLSLHAGGGGDMLRHAVETVGELGLARPRLLGITVLTSLGDNDLSDVGQATPTADQVRRLADLAQRCGLDGVVCSAREVASLRDQCGADFTLMVPGVRPTWAAADDQKRVKTPAEAIDAGADYLVIGRPITQAADPTLAVQRIAGEIVAG
jgi:orotidine-5'-phosphate decarboxylase